MTLLGILLATIAGAAILIFVRWLNDRIDQHQPKNTNTAANATAKPTTKIRTFTPRGQ